MVYMSPLFLSKQPVSEPSQSHVLPLPNQAVTSQLSTVRSPTTTSLQIP